MKIANLTLAMFFVIALTACAPVNSIEPINPILRDEVAANLDPLLKMEKRVDQLKYYTQMLGSLGKISEDKSKDLKKHFDVYYVYYFASNVYLAKGNIQSYMEHIKQAERELDVMEAILKEGLTQERDTGPAGIESPKPNLL